MGLLHDTMWLVLVSDILRRAGRLHADKPALRFMAREIRYRELESRSRRAASALAGGLGLAPGERFAVLCPNRPEILELVFAAALSGTIIVPVNARLAAPEVTRILAHSGARALLAAEELRPVALAAAQAGYDGSVVWLGSDDAKAGSWA